MPALAAIGTVGSVTPARSETIAQVASLPQGAAAGTCDEDRAVGAAPTAAGIGHACAPPAKSAGGTSADREKRGFLGILMLLGGGSHPFGLFR
ncbi:MAG TPA: hypothetical protein VET85_11770 [Stellaceae bacterium]|nr:hypothetical protein [Stellaceae bacterium]